SIYCAEGQGVGGGKGMSQAMGLMRFAGSRLLRIVNRVEHRRSLGGVLRRGAVDKDEARRASASSWWGAEPRWYPGGTPPRLHNRLTPLIHGESYFRALAQALDEAQRYAYIAGWCLTPHIPLIRDDPDALVDSRLLALLSRTAQRVPVRILLWSGAGALYQPPAQQVEAVKATIEREGEGEIEC